MSLDGCMIAFAGSHTGFAEFNDKKIADLKNFINNCGGNYSAKVTEECTHLVASKEQYSRSGAKVKDADKYPQIRIVDYGWLSESFNSPTKVHENPYLVVSSASDQVNGKDDEQAAASTQSSDNRKRPHISIDASGSAATSADNVSTAPLSKKLKPSDDTILASKSMKAKDGQKAKSASLNVPVDENCPLGGRSSVYIADDGTIFDVTLNQTNSGNNNNKFYRIQLLVNNEGDFFTWTRWGRVGESGQKKMLGDGDFASALKEFDKKFKDKTGNKWADRTDSSKPGKYTSLERSYEDASSEEDDDLPGAGKKQASKESAVTSTGITPSVESKLPGPVQRLMKLIFNQEYFNATLDQLDYDANKMPLGKLSKRTLLQGYEVLKDLALLVNDPAAGHRIEDKSNRYFSLIPHSFGRHRPPVLSSTAMIRKEIELLEALTDMQLANDIMNKAKKSDDEDVNVMDRQFQGLGLKEMTPLDMASNEFKQLQDYLLKSAGATHGLKYKVQDIFRIERDGELDRFRPHSSIRNSDRRLLWHGSRCTNFGGILSEGLRIAPPQAPVSGYMFGKGVYLADMSTKSANYCAPYTSGNTGLLLLCEAELGRPPLKLTDSDYDAGERAKKMSCISTWGVGQTAPQAWIDAGYLVHDDLKGVLMPDVSVSPGPSNEENAFLMYNEYIVYDISQIRLRYLLRVEIR